MDTDNSYEFEVESEALEVKPILRILHPALESVAGTANGRAEIKGTVAALARTDTNESDSPVYPYDVDITIDTSRLDYENSNGQKTPFTNAEPIELYLKDDKWTIDALSLRTLADESSFMELTGTYNAKGEVMDFEAKSDGFGLAPFGAALGLPSDMLKGGSGRYTSTITGMSKQPAVALDWEIPTLDLKTEVGDIRISDARGAIVHRGNLTRFEKTALKLSGNAVDIGGEINVSPENINDSRLNFSVQAPELELTRFSDLIAKASANRIKPRGVLAASIDITGTPAETVIAVHARTETQQPIRLTAYVDPITLESLHATATLNSDALHVQSIAADGRIGDGSYTVRGDVSFSTQDAAAHQFAIDMSVSDLGIADCVTVLSGQVPPFRGTVSGHAKLSGQGNLHPDHVSITGEVSALNFQGYGINCTNTTPLQFQSERGALTAHLPLELRKSDGVFPQKSPEKVTTVNVDITGTLEAPEITTEWRGDISEMEWHGKVEYRDERVTLTGIEIKNRAGTSTITGVIPFNLAFVPKSRDHDQRDGVLQQGIDLSDRFLDVPIDVRFRGKELPLDFFPGSDLLFPEGDGTVDINLALQGTSRDPHTNGDCIA